MDNVKCYLFIILEFNSIKKVKPHQKCINLLEYEIS
jgi:hypothetical protein